MEMVGLVIAAALAAMHRTAAQVGRACWVMYIRVVMLGSRVALLAREVVAGQLRGVIILFIRPAVAVQADILQRHIAQDN